MWKEALVRLRQGDFLDVDQECWEEERNPFWRKGMRKAIAAQEARAGSAATVWAHARARYPVEGDPPAPATGAQWGQRPRRSGCVVAMAEALDREAGVGMAPQAHAATSLPHPSPSAAVQHAKAQSQRAHPSPSAAAQSAKAQSQRAQEGHTVSNGVHHYWSPGFEMVSNNPLQSSQPLQLAPDTQEGANSQERQAGGGGGSASADNAKASACASASGSASSNEGASASGGSGGAPISKRVSKSAKNKAAAPLPLPPQSAVEAPVQANPQSGAATVLRALPAAVHASVPPQPQGVQVLVDPALLPAPMGQASGQTSLPPPPPEPMPSAPAQSSAVTLLEVALDQTVVSDTVPLSGNASPTPNDQDGEGEWTQVDNGRRRGKGKGSGSPSALGGSSASPTAEGKGKEGSSPGTSHQGKVVPGTGPATGVGGRVARAKSMLVPGKGQGGPAVVQGHRQSSRLQKGKSL